MRCLSLLLVLLVLFLAGSEVPAGPFARRCPSGQCKPAESLPVIGQSQESRPSPEIPDHHAPQPWSLTLVEGNTFSLQPDTALEAVPGTGSKSPTGLLNPKVDGKIIHSFDPATLDKLKEALLPNKQPVNIGLALPDETSQRLSRILMLLEWLLWLGGGVFGTTSVGKLLPLAARVVDGLRSAIPAPLPAPSPIPAATFSAPPKT